MESVPTTDQGSDQETQGESTQQSNNWLSIARDFIESQGYEFIKDGPLPDSFVVSEKEMEPLRGGTFRWLVHAQAGVKPEVVLSAEKLRGALDKAEVSGFIAVYQYPDDATYKRAQKKVRETMEAALSDRYRWRLVSATEIETNPEMNAKCRSIYQEKFAGKQTTRRAMRRVNEDRLWFFLGLLMVWGMAAFAVKRAEVGQSMLASFAVSYGWVLLIAFVVGFIGTLFFAPLYMAVKKWGPYVIALILLPLAVWMWAGSYNPARDLVAALLAFVVVLVSRSLFQKLEALLIKWGITHPEKAKIWQRRAKAASWLVGVWIFASLGDKWFGTGWLRTSLFTADVADVVLFDEQRFEESSVKSF